MLIIPTFRFRLNYKNRKKLSEAGHQIVMDKTVMKVGSDWRKDLLNELKSSDGVLVLITENSINSKYVISEIGTARAFIDENENRKFLIPIVYGNVEIPDFINDIYCIRLFDGNFDESMNKIEASISSFIGKKEAIEEQETKKRFFIEAKAEDYISVATTALKKREFHNKTVAYICYIIGFLTMAIGVSFAIKNLTNVSETLKSVDVSTNIIWFTVVILLLKSVIIIGLLLACSKYTFTLGKSFMHEALRNSDRIHAISFGEFVIKAYGDKISSYSEINDLFQNWNIDKSSSFQLLDTDSYDPKFNESFIEVIKSLSDKIPVK
ncbi:toll/interleukin-1 receptor domain-containing protein [Empedobacter brevis]